MSFLYWRSYAEASLEFEGQIKEVDGVTYRRQSDQIQGGKTSFGAHP